MKAIRYTAPKDFNIVEVPEPLPAPGEVLIHPLAIGLCFTDKHWYEGIYGTVGGMIGGHEFCGRVVAVGSDVDGVQVDDFVSIDPHLGCALCEMCRAGLSMRCQSWGTRVIGVHPEHDGGLADFCAVPAYSCYQVSDSLSVEAVASLDPAAIATRAVRHGGVRIGDNVVVFGAEDYGLFAISWLRAAGVNQIVCVDPLPGRRAAALAMGAHEAVDPRDVSVLPRLRQLMPAGADVVFVSCEDYISEADQYLAQAFAIARPQGTVIPLRFYGAAPFANVLPHDPWLKEVKMLPFGLFFGEEPVQGGRPRGDWQVAIDALSDGRISAPPVGYRSIEFDSLCTKRDVDDLFQSIPSGQTKMFVTL